GIDSGNPQKDAERALRLMVDRRLAPHGLGIFLKAAWIEEATRDSITLEMPAGPGAERLSGESPARVEVSRLLGELLGRPVTLSGRTSGADRRDPPRATPPGRSTPERVRKEKLAALAKGDAALKSAIETWDLELID